MSDDLIRSSSDDTAGDRPAMADLRSEIERLRAALVTIKMNTGNQAFANYVASVALGEIAPMEEADNDE